MISIRHAEAGDLDCIARIYEEIFGPDYVSFSELAEGKSARPGTVSPGATAIFVDQLREDIDNPTSGFFVAEADVPIGFALASLREAKAGHLECWLDDLGVMKQWQRKGIGRMLVRAVLEWGDRSGAKYFLLETGAHNHQAHEFFHRVGFQSLAAVFWRQARGEDSI